MGADELALKREYVQQAGENKQLICMKIRVGCWI
jgi:hypothetical protein